MLRLLILSLAAIGCGERIIALDLPPLAGARSAIFAFHAPGQFEARALDLEADEISIAFPVSLDPNATGSIEALVFEETLEDLGLSKGPLVSSAEGASIPAQDAVYVASFRGTDAEEWSEADERSAELEELKVPLDIGCSVLEPIASFQIDSAVDHTFAFAIDGERVIIASEDQKAYVVEESGAQPITDLPGRLPLDDVVVFEDGSLMLGGRRGEVWTARVGTSTTASGIAIHGELFTTLPSGERIVRLAGGRENGALELFAVGRMGGIYRYDGSSWTVLHQLGVDVTTATDVIRPEPGLAYAGSDEKAEVVRYRDGVVEVITPPDLVNGVPGMEYLENYGLVIARSEGGMYRLTGDSEWEFIEGSPISVNVYVFHGLANGFLFGGAFGFVSEYRIGSGYCSEVQVGAGSIRSITPVGDFFVLGEDKPMSRDHAQVSLLRVR